MKHITLAIALIFACISANAATINWGSNGTTSRFLIDGDGGTGSSNRLPSGSLVALVYLGKETSFTFDDTLAGSYSWDPSNPTESKTGITGGTVVSTLNLSSGGRGTGTYESSPYSSMNGNYGMIFFDATSWDEIKEGTKYGITTAVSTINLANEIDNTQNALLTSNVGTTGTISAVPEPSTAALALAGLALLLKRRKA